MRSSFVMISVMVCCVFACKQKPPIDLKKVESNLKQYATAHIDDVASIDSILFFYDSVTESSKIKRQAELHKNASSYWKAYNATAEFDHSIYTADVCLKNAAMQDSIAKVLFEKSKQADSTRLLMWFVQFSGLYTKQDMTRGTFTHTQF